MTELQKETILSSTEALTIITSFLGKMFSATSASKLSYKHSQLHLSTAGRSRFFVMLLSSFHPVLRCMKNRGRKITQKNYFISFWMVSNHLL